MRLGEYASQNVHSNLFFRPTTSGLVFFAGGLLKKVSVSGGTPTTICDASGSRGGSWNEEDLIVFAPSSRTGLSLVSADGGTAEPLTVLDDEYGETTHRIPMFLPGGDAFLFLAAGNTREATRVVVHSISSGERRVLVEGATLPRYSPSGHLLYVQGGASMAAPFDVERLELSGRGVPVLPVEATLLALSAAGTLVYLADEISEAMRQLVWVNRIGQEEPLTALARRYMHPRLSPDERRVAVDIEQDGDRAIWMYDFGRESLTRLTFAGSNLWPTWSPDGLRVAYASNRPDTVWDIYWSRADGAGSDEALWTDPLAQFPRSWSSDGRTLVAVQIDPETLSDIWLLTLDGNMPRPWLQTAAVEAQSVMSPNGQWIAYLSNESGQFEVYVGPFSGTGKWQISTDGGQEPLWSRDGTELFYWSGNKMYVARVSAGDTFQHETPVDLLEGTYYRSSTGHQAYDVSDDGRFLMVKPEPESPPIRLDIVLNWFNELERLVPTEK